VLDRIGLPHVPVYSPMQDETMHRDTGVVGKDLVRLTWRGALAVDMFQKALFEHRPYEKNKGESDRVYHESLNRLVSAIEQKKDLRPALRKAYRDFRDVEISERDKPVIGIVGEIYVRSNRFSNEDVIRQVEMLGGEAWLAPVSEWLLYVTETSKTSARMRRAWKDLIKAHLTDWFQGRDERAFLSTFNGTLRSLHEPAIKRTLRTARPYIHHSFEGEAVLSVGKAIDYVRRGVSGIVNVMPLSCMPGTIASAVLKRVREEHGNIPLLNIAYEGQKDSQTLTRLEAFMHQAGEYREGKEKKKS
jgi:predicted nucleotide-binding protein (sugar kinase/HSP70/actin superfamily)